MSQIKLPHLDSFVDRHGCRRTYFRYRRGKRVCLPDPSDTASFLAAYNRALSDVTIRHPARPEGYEKGTWNALIKHYYSSRNFTGLRPASQQSYRITIDAWLLREHLGMKKVTDLTRHDVIQMQSNLADKPGSAYNLLKCIRVLVVFAQDLGWLTVDPTGGIKRPKLGQIHTWTEIELAQFEARWPLGTRERTMFALLLYTGQRSGDVRMMQWSDIDLGLIQVIQQKTGRKLKIPIHYELKRALDSMPREHLAIIPSRTGQPYLATSFSILMADAIDAANLPDRCKTHGLRKAAARRLAEAGCSTKMIMAVTGHLSLAEVERYTIATEQEALASAAITKLYEHEKNDDSQT